MWYKIPVQNPEYTNLSQPKLRNLEISKLLDEINEEGSNVEHVEGGAGCGDTKRREVLRIVSSVEIPTQLWSSWLARQTQQVANPSPAMVRSPDVA